MKSFDGKKYFSKICKPAEADLLKVWARAHGIPATDYDIAGYGPDILVSWWLTYPDVCKLVNFIDSM